MYCNATFLLRRYQHSQWLNAIFARVEGRDSVILRDASTRGVALRRLLRLNCLSIHACSTHYERTRIPSARGYPGLQSDMMSVPLVKSIRKLMALAARLALRRYYLLQRLFSDLHIHAYMSHSGH